MYGITGLGNAFDCYVMNSAQKTDEIVAEFEKAIYAGLHPNDVEQDIYLRTGTNPADLTNSDKNYIQNKVSAIYQAYMNMDTRGW